jgi:hypothetical protein
MPPASQRSAVIVVLVAAIVGSGFILAQEAFREPLAAWLTADPDRMAPRARLLIAIAGSFLVVPLLAFAAYMWRLAGTLEQPRARGLKVLAMFLVAGAVALAGIMWRLAVVLTAR